MPISTLFHQYSLKPLELGMSHTRYNTLLHDEDVPNVYEAYKIFEYLGVGVKATWSADGSTGRVNRMSVNGVQIIP